MMKRGVISAGYLHNHHHQNILLLLIVRGVISTGYEGGGEVGVALGEAPINPR